MRTYSQQKSGLTRAINSKNYAKIVSECTRTVTEWQQLPYGWPDDWHRWNRALEDAWWHIRHEYISGRIDELPICTTLDNIRWQVLGV